MGTAGASSPMTVASSSGQLLRVDPPKAAALPCFPNYSVLTVFVVV